MLASRNFAAKKDNGVIPLIVFITFVATLVVFGWHIAWPGLTLAIKPQNVMAAMAPLLLTATFIERSVEVFISPWRDPKSGVLETKLSTAMASSAAIQSQIVAGQDLEVYKGETKQYAFAIALTLGLAAAVVGVRALWPFVELQGNVSFSAASGMQQAAFKVVDVALSALLLAGGANGIHSAVNAFTTFFDATAQKARQSADS
jgi:hypothetical protein